MPGFDDEDNENEEQPEVKPVVEQTENVETEDYKDYSSYNFTQPNPSTREIESTKQYTDVNLESLLSRNNV